MRVSEARTVSVACIAKGTLLNEEGLPINLSFLENEVFNLFFFFLYVPSKNVSDNFIVSNCR